MFSQKCLKTNLVKKEEKGRKKYEITIIIKGSAF